MLTAFTSLLELTRGRELRRGNALCISAASKYAYGEIYPVRMTEVQWNDRLSYEFPLLLEALVDVNMIDNLWSGSFFEAQHRTNDYFALRGQSCRPDRHYSFG